MEDKSIGRIFFDEDVFEKFSDYFHLSVPDEPSINESDIEIIYDLYADNKMSDNLTTQTIMGVQVFPNPFNSSTTVIFELVIDQHINIAFYDLRGNRIEVLKDEAMLKGRHSLIWNGWNRSSQELSDGIYILRVIGENNIEQKTIVKVN